jgi:hypothetical protein
VGNRQSTVTSSKGQNVADNWRVGIYLGTDVILQHPDYLRQLQSQIGLTTVVLSFTGDLPEDVRRKSPFAQSPPTEEQLTDLVMKHMDGQPVDPREFARAQDSMGPGLGARGDDESYRAAIATLRELGLDVWLCGSSWTIRRLMFCPSRSQTGDWFEAVYRYWAKEYDIDALDLTHARYPMGSFPLGLFGCTCTHCQMKAAEMGYDMPAMLAGLRAVGERLRELDGGRLGECVRLGIGFFDVVQALDLSSSVLDWFRFRCELLRTQLTRYRNAVHAESGGRILCGGDTFPASMSLTAGHDHRRWADHFDFASPLVSHISAFVVNTLVEWAQFLQEQVGPELDEADALATIYRFCGYDGMGLPESYDEINIEAAGTLAERVPVADLVIRDLAKAKLFLPPQTPSFPIIHGEGWQRDTIDTIVGAAQRLGHDGVIWQGTSELVDYDLN